MKEYFLLSEEPFRFREQLSANDRLRLTHETLTELFVKPSLRGEPSTTAHELNVLIDALFGLQLESISTKIAKIPKDQILEKYGPEKILKSYPTPLLFTPYFRIHKIVEKLNPQPGHTLIDIGSGFGRMGFYLAILYPEVRFLGYEILAERCLEAKRVARALGLGPNTQFLECNVGRSDFKVAAADFYFLYDSLVPPTLEKVFRELRSIGQKQRVQIAMSGRLLYHYMQNLTWLKETHTNQELGFAIFEIG